MGVFQYLSIYLIKNAVNTVIFTFFQNYIDLSLIENKTDILVFFTQKYSKCCNFMQISITKRLLFLILKMKNRCAEEIKKMRTLNFYCFFKRLVTIRLWLERLSHFFFVAIVYYDFDIYFCSCFKRPF
ncbi:hypothetical protein EDEG_00950 [Edhazardia aedis USNM 41457]|uniref:Uncharacterized protein n=1 Tax=Edhazardia aedis (strain USNM 41457) TaxID=1003232 RepID=J9DU81_EDHAE|nr:hypothetical protein EDEG_00950 [Edhazardia aedis USNM 41457]|eukprot:EJW04857.1 hypothetical protein EDEG_00950 [Edhazardia aedis USNM 41457]